MEETSTDKEWSIYHPRPGETQLDAAIRYLRSHPDEGFTRKHITEMVGVPERNLGELAREARTTWMTNRPGLYCVQAGRPRKYAWLTTDFDRAVNPAKRKGGVAEQPPLVEERGNAITLRQVFANGDITVYRDPDGDLVRLVPVDFVFVDRS